jgi:hypothetical protein
MYRNYRAIEFAKFSNPYTIMLYRSLLGKGLPLYRVTSMTPHRGSLASVSVVPQSISRNSFVNPSGAIMAGSPLFVTDLSKPFDFSEIQFVLSEQINNIFEMFGETEAGTWFLNTAVFFTLLRMFAYYSFWQPSALRHFQMKYGQSWNVGHHLYGSSAPNPLRK